LADGKGAQLTSVLAHNLPDQAAEVAFQKGTGPELCPEDVDRRGAFDEATSWPAFRERFGSGVFASVVGEMGSSKEADLRLLFDRLREDAGCE
jgi:hypothetical protein